MIHCVIHGNRHLYSAEIDAMFLARKAIFIDRLGWSGLSHRDGREIDEYDDERTAYLLALDQDGKLVASVRMRPAEDKSLLAGKFPHLVESKVDLPALGDWEASRYVVLGDPKEPLSRKLRDELRLAAMELVYARGARRFVGMSDVSLLPVLMRSGWNYRLLGAPAAYPEGEVIAYEVRCDVAAILKARDRLGVHSPVLLELPPAISRENGISLEELATFSDAFGKLDTSAKQLLGEVMRHVAARNS